MLRDLFFRLRSLLRHDATGKELDQELLFHFDQQVDKYVRSGLTREEAIRRFRLEFGGLDQVKQQCREARGVTFLETLVQDVRFGLRMFRRDTGFTAIVVLTLALGIGANTAIFSLIDAVLLKMLPVKDPQQLVALTDPTFEGVSIGSSDGERGNLSNREFEALRDRTQSFSDMLAAQSDMDRTNASIDGKAPEE